MTVKRDLLDNIVQRYLKLFTLILLQTILFTLILWFIWALWDVTNPRDEDAAGRLLSPLMFVLFIASVFINIKILKKWMRESGLGIIFYISLFIITTGVLLPYVMWVNYYFLGNSVGIAEINIFEFYRLLLLSYYPSF